MKKSEMALILGEVKLLFGHHELTEPEIEAWYNFFGEEEPIIFRKAFRIAAKSSKFFPTPGIIEEELDRIKKGAKDLARIGHKMGTRIERWETANGEFIERTYPSETDEIVTIPYKPLPKELRDKIKNIKGMH